MDKNKYIKLDSSKNISLRARKVKSGYSLFLDIHLNGKRFRESLNMILSCAQKRNWKTTDKNIFKVAKEIMAKRSLEVAKGEYIPPKQRSNKPDTENFIEIFQRYVEYKINNQSPQKWKWISTLKHFKRFLGKDFITADDVNVALFDDFKEYLKYHSGLKQNSASTYLSQFSTFLNYAVKHNIIDENPIQHTNNINRLPTDRKYLTLEDLSKLAKAHVAGKDLKIAFFFACNTGLSYADIVNLKWSDIHEDDGDKYILFVRQKTQKPNRLYLNKNAIAIIANADSSRENVFDMPHYRNVRTQLNLWGTRANLDKRLTFHLARHTFATLGLSNGIDIKTMKDLLGHADIKTTEIYAKVIDRRKRDAVHKIPIIELT